MTNVLADNPTTTFNFDEQKVKEILQSIATGSIRLNKASSHQIIAAMLGIKANELECLVIGDLTEPMCLNIIKLFETIESTMVKTEIKSLLLASLENRLKPESKFKLSKERFNGYDPDVELITPIASAFLIEEVSEITNGKATAIEAALQRVALTACAFGGLAFKEALVALLDKLCNDNKPLREINDKQYVEFEYSKSAHPTNANGNETKTSTKTFYSDPLTSMAIHHFLELKKRSKEEIKPINYSGIVNKLLNRIKKSAIDGNVKQNKILAALFISGQRLSRLNIPFFLNGFCSGHVYSASPTANSFLAHANLHPKPPASAHSISVAPKVSFSSLQTDSTEYNQDRRVLLDLLEICENEKRHMDRKTTLIELAQLRTSFDFNIQTELLFEFIYRNMQVIYKSNNHKWEVGKGTAKRYLSAIGDIWLSTFEIEKIDELADDEMDMLYEYMCNAKQSTDSTAPDTLSLLFKFIGENYAISIPSFIREGGNGSHVRSQLICDQHYQYLRQDMCLQYSNQDEYFLKSLDVLLIVIRRCFLRPSEAFKLHINDIEISDELYLNIRKSFRGQLKTHNAVRLFPMGIFLKPDESYKVRSFVAERKRQSKRPAKDLLFSQSLNDNIMFDSTVVNRVATEFLSNYANERVVFYQMRHTGISYLQLMLLGSTKDACFFTGYSESEILRIRTFLKTQDGDLLYQISRLAGHLSPETTLMHYCHFTDLLLGYFVNNNRKLFTVDFISNLSGLSQKYLKLGNRAAAKTSEEQSVSLVRVAPIILKSLSKYTTSHKQLKEKHTIVKDEQKGFTPDFSKCKEILLSLDGGMSSNEIYDSFGYPLQYINACESAADNTNTNFVTSKGKSRLFTAKQKGNLAPISLPKANENLELFALTRDMLKASKNTQKLKNHLEFVLSNVEQSHSYIQFKSLKKLTSFIEFFSKMVKKDRWHCVVEPLDHLSLSVEAISEKTGICKNRIELSKQTVKDKSKFADARIKLYFLHPREQSLVNLVNEKNAEDIALGHTFRINKYSCVSFIRACHWILIYLWSLDGFDEHLEAMNSPQLEFNL